MLKKILIGVAVAVILIAGILAYLRSATKKHSPEATISYKHNTLDLQVKYCQPYKKNRVIFGDKQTGALQPYGEYWRVGANEATTFTTATAIQVQGQKLSAGKYALYAIPGQKEWTIAFNTENDRWGATPPDEKNDVLRVTVKSEEQTSVQEQFVISFEPSDSNVTMLLNWDNVKVFVPISE